MKHIKSLIALACLSTAGCSSEPRHTTAEKPSELPLGTGWHPVKPVSGTAQLSAAGLADLRIGEPVPAPSSWSISGPQGCYNCTIATSPAYNGVSALLEQGKVQRITIGQGSSVQLAGDIGIGTSEADVKKRFSALREEPHKYKAAPAKYLTTVNAGPKMSGFRFEISADGKVAVMHAGQMPALAYVEGRG